MFLRFQPKDSTTEHRSYQMEYKSWHEAARQDLRDMFEDDEIEKMSDSKVAEIWEQNDEIHHFAHAGVSCFDTDIKYFGMDAYEALIDYIFSDTAYTDVIESDSWEIIEFDGYELETGYDDECIAEIDEILNRYSVEEFMTEYGIEHK